MELDIQLPEFPVTVTASGWPVIPIKEVGIASYLRGEIKPFSKKLSRFKDILESGDLSDVTLVVGPDKTEIKAHKMMLASQSDYFKALFYGSGSKQFIENENARVLLPEHEVLFIRQLLEHIYTEEYCFGEEGETCLDNHAQMLCLGSHFQVQSLRLMAMDRFAYWTSENLENLVTSLDPMIKNDIRIKEQYCNKVLDTIDHIWSNTTKSDRKSLLLVPFMDFLQWFLGLKDERLEKLTEKHLDLGFEMLMAQHDGATAFTDTSRYKDSFNDIQVPISYCEACKVYTTSNLFCRGCDAEVDLGKDNFTIITYCKGCNRNMQYLKTKCGLCHNDKNIFR